MFFDWAKNGHLVDLYILGHMTRADEDLDVVLN